MFRTAALIAGLVVTPAVAAEEVYLWAENMEISLGPGMAEEPFRNRTSAESLRNAIDLPAADAAEYHNQQTHVWVRGDPVRLEFDLLDAYDLIALHFWNYHSEGYDVDRIDLIFRDVDGNIVGDLTGLEPRLGNTRGSDSVPVTAETYPLAFNTQVRYVSAELSGSNGQTDWNNIGFTARLSAFGGGEDEGPGLMSPIQ
ncbi:MAG: hypothetical protein AAF409_05665 [Pseudomonadota bacterium]